MGWKWSENEKTILKENVDLDEAELHKLLPLRSEKAIRGQRYRMGLLKNIRGRKPKYISEIKN